MCWHADVLLLFYQLNATIIALARNVHNIFRGKPIDITGICTPLAISTVGICTSPAVHRSSGNNKRKNMAATVFQPPTKDFWSQSSKQNIALQSTWLPLKESCNTSTIAVAQWQWFVKYKLPKRWRFTAVGQRQYGAPIPLFLSTSTLHPGHNSEFMAGAAYLTPLQIWASWGNHYKRRKKWVMDLWGNKATGEAKSQTAFMNLTNLWWLVWTKQSASEPKLNNSQTTQQQRLMLASHAFWNFGQQWWSFAATFDWCSILMYIAQAPSQCWLGKTSAAITVVQERVPKNSFPEMLEWEFTLKSLPGT